MVPPRHLDALLYARQTDGSNCIPCSDPPPCNCGSNEQCIVVNRDCNTCSFNRCVPITSGKKSGGVSAGAVAGAVIASVIFLILGVLAFLWYRRRQRRLAAASHGGEVKREAPARAEDVLNRPDPNEKPPSPAPQDNFRVYAGNSTTTINLDPRTQNSSAIGTPGHSGMRMSVQSNPFEDSHSIQTTSTGTQSNVIPIALVGPGSTRSDPSQVLSNTNATAGTAPIRPARDPALNINTDNQNAQFDASRTPTAAYEQSTVSGFTGYNRNSYMTTGSYASDLLSEAPVIITPTHGTIKQVLGTAKAEVIRTAPMSDRSTTPGSADSCQTTFLNVASNRQTARSPLAASSFGPGDLSQDHQSQDVQVDQGPFGDEHSPYLVNGSAHPSPAPSQRSFAIPEETPSPYTGEPMWSPEQPRRPWDKARPDSVSTQAQSIIGAEFASATRVNIGLNQLSAEGYEAQDAPVSAALSTPRTPYRMTSAKLVSPTNGNGQPARSPISPAQGGAFESQQRRALEELDAAQRMSRASVLSSTSTKADSILEGFPFVPPSPISDRPLRTPPRSPLAKQAFTGSPGAGSQPPSPNLVVPTVSIQPLSLQKDQKKEVQQESGSEDGPAGRARPPKKQQSKFAPPVMNRKVLGLSTASQSSTASNGLGSFPFQIDTGVTTDSASSTTPSSYASDGRQRASLDTLALTSDLSSYPLGFDKNIMDHYPGAQR